MLFSGFASLRSGFVSGKVIRSGGGFLYTIVVREFHLLHEVFEDLSDCTLVVLCSRKSQMLS